jgi:hypothetical protein
MVSSTKAQRRRIIQQLNAYDSGPAEDDRRAVKELDRCVELLAEVNRWPCTRTFRIVCSKR